MTDVLEQPDGLANTDAAGIFRVCPKCHHIFTSHNAWVRNTEAAGSVTREMRFRDVVGLLRDGRFELEVRRHSCGGENYSRGRLVTTRMVGS